MSAKFDPIANLLGPMLGPLREKILGLLDKIFAQLKERGEQLDRIESKLDLVLSGNVAPNINAVKQIGNGEENHGEG